MAHSCVSYEGYNILRHRLVLSTGTGKPGKIRTNDDIRGLRGTTLYFQTGLLYGGAVEHDCSLQRFIGYYLEAMLALAPFMKNPLKAVLRGFGLSLIAEMTNGTNLSAEMASNPPGQGTPILPEELGKNCANLLLEEIYRGGCVDSINLSLALLYMTLGQQDVSKVLLGPLSLYTIEFLRHLRSFFQTVFKIEALKPEEDGKGGEKVLMTCVGLGSTNLSKTLK
ncbi:RNA 3'-terminal phosphate cyclase-like protein [Polyodon spathula]|uniref:RNA 3'-terminal phosphate cyclase-like protein n=1 Tax=Polyodon spathula TaxID=7913 RepID=UPI001B7E7923|nr:RNA 3'-terminal phosphate cyclase-like protein [Polyodon spathula]